MGTLIAGTNSISIGAAVFETSTGNKVAVFIDTNDDIAVWDDLDGTPTQAATRTDAQFFGGTAVFGGLGACIDSSDVIHIIGRVFTAGIGGGVEVSYITLSGIDSTPSWGSPEGIEDYENDQPSYIGGCSIAVDQNDVPHVLFAGSDANKGSSWDQIRYANRIGGTWSTPEDVNATANNHYHLGPNSLVVRDNNSAEALYYNAQDGGIYYNSRTSGSWGTESSYTTTTYRPTDVTGGVAQESSAGTIRRVHVATGTRNIYLDDVDSTFDGVAASVYDARAYIRNSNNTLYVLFMESSSTVDLIHYDGSWNDDGSVETGLTVATGDGVLTSWSYLIQNNDASLDYLYEDDGSIYWNEFSFGGGADPIAFTAGKLRKQRFQHMMVR